MKLRRFKVDKLVRDKSVERMTRQGAHVDMHILSSEEFIKSLKNKLLEEAAEVSTAPSRDDLVHEIADVYEVLDALCAASGIEKKEVLCKQEVLHVERGGFNERFYVTSVGVPEGTQLMDYVQQNPEKYPELSDAE